MSPLAYERYASTAPERATPGGGTAQHVRRADGAGLLIAQAQRGEPGDPLDRISFEHLATTCQPLTDQPQEVLFHAV